MKRYPAILSQFYNHPHCILREKLQEIEQVLLARARGEARDAEYVAPEPFVPLLYDLDGQEFAADQVPAAQQSRQFVAVLPMFGTLWQHAGLEMEYSGGTSTDALGAEIRRLDANPSIKSVVLHTHSPGGQAWGTEEASNALLAARQAGRTRFVASVNSMMASGALWIGTAAERVFITPGGTAGSIGVLTMHQDVSKSDEMAGVKTTLLAYPEKKIEGHQFEPLSNNARDNLVNEIKQTYDRFTSAVSRNRGVTQAKVETDFGGGGMLRAHEAVSAGLADDVATLHEVVQAEVSRLKQAGRASRRNQAAIL